MRRWTGTTVGPSVQAGDHPATGKRSGVPVDRGTAVPGQPAHPPCAPHRYRVAPPGPVLTGPAPEAWAAAAPTTLPDGLVDRIAVLRGRTHRVTELAGGLTNRNYKVATDGGTYVVRISGPGSGALAIDRDHEYRNSVIAGGLRCRRPGHRVPARATRHWSSGSSRGGPSPTTTSDAPGVIERVAASCRRLHDGGRFVNDFDMFDDPARLPAPIGARRGATGCRTATSIHRRRRADPGGPGGPGRADGGLQQRPAGRELHR